VIRITLFFRNDHSIFKWFFARVVVQPSRLPVRSVSDEVRAESNKRPRTHLSLLMVLYDGWSDPESPRLRRQSHPRATLGQPGPPELPRNRSTALRQYATVPTGKPSRQTFPQLGTAITATQTKNDGSLRFCCLFPRTLRGKLVFVVIRTSNARKKRSYYDYYIQTG
jgi:hypothetical protein